MEFDDFEQELRQALVRRPAPPSLKRRLMERRSAKGPAGHRFLWQKIAAVLVVTTMLGGGVAWHEQQEEQRKGEAARQQVLLALRITNHALDQMNAQLAAHGRAHR